MELIRKWRNYNIVKENFPAMADTYLQQFTMEDDLFSLTLRARQHPNNSEYRDLIRNKVRDLVQLGFEQRTLRVNQLRQMLADETRRLADDREHEDQIIETRTDRILSRIGSGNLRSSTRPTSQLDVEDMAMPARIPAN
jgi:hypothetical protein